MINVTSLFELPEKDRLEIIDSLNDDEIKSLKYEWVFWARPDQLEPPELADILSNIFIWMVKSGRGFGKTRMFAEWVNKKIQFDGYRNLSLAGAAADEVRDIMIEGESGIMACSPPWFRPIYEPSKKRLTWPNGAKGTIFYGTEPDKSRGAQSDLIWMDEIAKWKYPEDTFDNLLFGLRLGNNPLCGVSSTPRPTKFIKDLCKRDDIVITEGSTYDNIDNLATPFVKAIISKYKGTRLGRQEIFGAVLDDNPNALWQRGWIDDSRIQEEVKCHKMIIAIDPQAVDNPNSSETGIVVVGEGKSLPGMPHQDLPHYYVFEDLTRSATPEKWANTAVMGYDKYDCDRIIAEKNNGGEMVKSVIKNVKDVPVSLVWASRGKYIRAEPVSSLYEQGRVHHIGTLADLEDQQCEWIQGDKSPDRLDALVWGISWLADISINVEAPSIRKLRQREKRKSIVGNLPEL